MSNKIKIEESMLKQIIKDSVDQHYFKNSILSESNQNSLKEVLSYKNLSKIVLEAVINSQDVQDALKEGRITTKDAINLCSVRLANHLMEETLKRTTSKEFVRMMEKRVDNIK